MASPNSTSDNIPVRGRDITSVRDRERTESPNLSSSLRQATINRLGSPIPGSGFAGAHGQFGTPPLAGPGSPPRFGTPSRFANTSSPPPDREGAETPLIDGSKPPSIYGSVDARTGLENPEVVRRHLVTEDPGPSSSSRGGTLGGAGLDDEEFNSLQLQGGDVTRQIYQWDAEQRNAGAHLRSKSFHVLRPNPEEEVLDIQNIKVPGGFRRNFLRRAAADGSPSRDGLNAAPPAMLTRNFIEFLSIYGHFAGEALEEEEYISDEDEDEPDEGDEEAMENSALLGSRSGRRKKTKAEMAQGKNDVTGAVLLLLKSFVGTGVVFLPKAFLNGGMLFSTLLLLFVAGVSYYCFVLLVKTRLKINGSFGDIGGILYGPKMRSSILFSIVISQIGFASAYFVFVSENLQAFILAVTDCKTYISVKWLVLLQLVIFLPFSMIRDISKLGVTALVADLFIFLGLIYLYYSDFFTIAKYGVADYANFNDKDWTLFIGTAIFTFEGIGLIIPIQESMKQPKKFPAVLGGVMVIITAIFCSMGAISYAAYGSKTKTVILLNLPQDSRFVNSIQLLYSLAILLSTPLQLFPAIRIMENGLFTKSGKYSNKVKWQKNLFRFCTVMITAFVSWGGADDLDKFVALVGSFACIPLVYMYPPLLHMRACATRTITKVIDVLLFVFGTAVMIYTTAQTLKQWAGPPSQKPPGYCDNR